MKVKIETLEAFEQRMSKEMIELKSEMSALRTGTPDKLPDAVLGDARSRCAVWGGLSGTFKESSQWVKDQLLKLDMTLPPEIFVKGGEMNFKSILFTKFASKSQRDDVVSKMREHLELEDVWVKPDLPVRTRAMNGFLLGMKRLLVSWGYAKTHVYADLDAFLLRTGDEEIVKIIDSKLD